MPRRMSCSMTVDAVRDRTKTVTRRHVDTWAMLASGDRLTLVEKAMGLAKGQRQRVLAQVEIVNVRLEALSEITTDEIQREGVGLDWSVQTWIDWWKLEHGYHRNDDPDVRRIEWRYLDQRAEGADQCQP